MVKKKYILVASFFCLLLLVFILIIEKQPIAKEFLSKKICYPEKLNVKGVKYKFFTPEYYFKQNEKVYLKFAISPNAYADDQTPYPHDRYEYDEVIDADPKTFECIDYYYAKDKNNIYYWTKKIEGVDFATFEILDWPRAKDKNYIYKEGFVESKTN